MSVPATEGQEPIIDSQGSEVVDLLPQGDLAFSALMDVLAPETDADGSAAAAGADGAAAGADTGDQAAGAAGTPGGDAAAGGQAGTPGEGAGAAPAAGDDTGTGDAAGAAGTGDAGAGGAAAADGGRPDTWTQPAADVVPRFGELSTAFEENVSKTYHETSLAAVREEHAPYFEALEKHPRLLVGTQVPAIGKEGMETIRDTEDAREWQEAVKDLLVQEVRGRAAQQMEENSQFLSTVHASIELFQNNTDLIPGTKEFDVELANRFAEFASPYELRVEGKLQGYSIPVQPLVERIRAQLTQERTSAPAAAGTKAAPAAPAAGAPQAGTPATPPAPAAPPQAGIPSKAGNSDSSEDFSTLFGTIGLPNLQI